MNNEIFTLTAEPIISRTVYLKTALIVFGVAAIIHFSGQWRTPPLIDYRISLIICLILGLLALYGLTRSPFTKSLTIDYDKRAVIIKFLTLTKTDNLLEIPFENLGTKTDNSFGITGYGTKWKTSLLLDGKEVYSFFNSEDSFSEEQMDEFIKRIKKCEEESKR